MTFDTIVQLSYVTGLIVAGSAIVAFLYRRTGLRSLVRWFTRHIREDRAAERASQMKVVLAATIVPELQAVSNRLDNHMATEEASVRAVHEELQAIKNGVADHMEHDAQQFEAAQKALVAGQGRLDKKLDSINGKLSRMASRITNLEK